MEAAKQNRIQHLEKFLKEDPQNAFTHYALALELVEVDTERSLRLFDYLLQDHPDYTGTYYHAAALYAETGQIEKAQNIYEKGIEVLKTANEQKALQELQNAYQNFLFEEGLD